MKTIATAEDVLAKYVPHRPDDGCWEWIGYRQHGYGIARRGNTTTKAHRLSYELHVGPVPEGLILRHLCNNRSCVRPDHLRAGTHAENKADSIAAGTARGGNSYKTECIHGHPFDQDNTYTNAAGERSCRACHRATEQRRRDRQKEMSR